jgi:hypothetical protein
VKREMPFYFKIKGRGKTIRSLHNFKSRKKAQSWARDSISTLRYNAGGKWKAKVYRTSSKKGLV